MQIPARMPCTRKDIRVVLTICVLLLCLAEVAQARVTQVTISKTAPAFNGRSFGKVGAYEVIRGRATGEIDPADRRNAVITDIQFAPRNTNGKVTYTTTFSILKPVDMTKANGIMVYDVTNRGNPRFASRFTRFVLATGTGDPEYADPGDGSLYKARAARASMFRLPRTRTAHPFSGRWWCGSRRTCRVMSWSIFPVM
jgi:hypothetical protein